MSPLAFKNIKKDIDKIKEETNKQIDVIVGIFAEEIEACKEVVEKMVKKYVYKKEKFNCCVELKITRESELVQWKDKLVNMKDRMLIIESSLNILGVNDSHEGVHMYKKFLEDIDKLKSNLQNMEKGILAFQDKINEEVQDLNNVESKVVKTAQLE